MKALKWVLLGLGGLIVLVIVAVVIFVATFDPNAYKPRIVEFVKQQTGRTLTVEGDIGLTFFPKLGAAIGKVTLSEPKGTRTFAQVEEARVAVALLPLLAKRVLVDRVTLKGLAVDLVRYKDGRTNFDDLTGTGAKPEKPAEQPAQPPAGSPLAIDVGGITIDGAVIGWRDEREGTNVRLSNLTLETGRLASGESGKLEFAARVQGTQPRANLQINLETGYRLDFEAQAVALSSLDLRAAGDAPGVTGLDARLRGKTLDVDGKAGRVTLADVELTAKSKDGLEAKVSVPRLQAAPDKAESQAITADLKLVTPGRTVGANLQVPPFTASGKQLRLAKVDVQFTAKQADLAVEGKLATPVTLDLQAQQAALAGIAGDLTLRGSTIPNNSLRAGVTGAARADWGKQNASGDLAVKLDDSNIQAKLAVAHWSQPAITFNVAADRLNVDKYLPPSKPAAGGGAPAGGQPEQPLDLSALKTLNATGSVRVGALQVSNIKAEQVALDLKAAGGRLDLSPMSAKLYQGTLAGGVNVNANDNRVAAKQTLSGISIGPLLRDAANTELLEGRGTLTLDLTTAGATTTQLKKGLAGTAGVQLRDGAIKGIDIAGTIRRGMALLGSKSAIEEQAQGGAKTDFSELTASFTVKNGVAHNEDLQVKSPLLRLTGRGDIDIGEGKMDYVARASVVATATGQGGKELADVAGVTVPVRISGPLASLSYRLDVAALATELAKGRVQRELERRLGGKAGGQAGGQTGGQAGDGAGALGDALRGLFQKKR
ncbi:MAG: AsmA family protein [Candidatus Methylomirabilales bacterium]